MKHRHVLRASATLVVAGAAVLGCGGSGTTTSPISGAEPGGTSTNGPTTTKSGAAGTIAAGSGSRAMMPVSHAAGGRPNVGVAGATGGPAKMVGPSTGVAGTTAPTAGTTGAAGAMMGAAGSAGMMGGAAGAMAAGPGSCGPENKLSAADLGSTTMPGPWMPMHVENTGPTGSSWIFYPDGLGKNGLKHPVFEWGPGAGTGPSAYVDHLNLLASQGFVVISQSSTESGKQAIDWILKENEMQSSMWYQKLDTDRVGRGGHSMGALQAMSESDDPRLKLTVLVCGGANGSGGADKISYPSIFLGGEGEGGTTNFRGDYAQVTGLSIFVTKTNTDHIYCARNNLAPWVAFMRWQFCGEEKWKKEFMPGGTYCSSPWLDCMTKNF